MTRRDFFKLVLGGAGVTVAAPVISVLSHRDPVPEFQSGQILTTADLNQLVRRINDLS